MNKLPEQAKAESADITDNVESLLQEKPVLKNTVSR